MKNLLFLLLFLTSQIGFAQIVVEDCFADMDGNVYSNPQTMNVYYCVNLYFHIVRRLNGTGGVPTSRTQDVMNQLYSAYNQHYIQFNNAGFQYLDSDIAYNESAPYRNIVGTNGQQDRIDIYLFPEDKNCSGGAAYCTHSTKTGIGLGGSLRFTGWVVAQSFAAHEMGHILGLLHTFGPDIVSPEDYELIDGSNCTVKGDGFCDTPASYQEPSPHPCGSSLANLGTNFEVSSNCIWLNPKQEPSTGQYYTPDLNNYMEYTHPNCMTHFSDEQEEAMRAKIESQTVISPAVTSNIWGEIAYSGGSQDLYNYNFVSKRTFDIYIQAINVNNFDWTLTSSYSPNGNNTIPWGTYANGATAFMTIPQNGSATFEVDYNNICNLGPNTYTFIHAGGFYSAYPTTTSSTFDVKAIDNYEIPLNDSGETIKFKPYIETIEVLNNKGVRAVSKKYPAQTKEVRIDLSNRKKGVYFVKINMGSNFYAYETKVIRL